MRCYEISPNSFCNGVLNAINKIKNYLERGDCEKPVYMLGYLVHNKFVIDSFDDIIVIKDNILNKIDEITKGTVIITAHGTSPLIYNKLRQKNIKIIDTTCPNVLRVQTLIKSYINDNYKVYLLGNPNHPEIKGYLGIDENVSMYNGEKLPTNSYITTQTTLNYNETISKLSEIKHLNPDAICDNNICASTINRQNAVLKSINDYDLFIVIGDSLSNNCKSLFNLIKSYQKDVIIIESVNDLIKYNISKYNKIGVTAAASTPKVILKEVIDVINNNKPFTSTLSRKSYI